jgi:exopolysaccharide biosynthesis protein
MVNKTLFILLLICLLGKAPFASTLSQIRFGYYPEKIRAVFDFEDSFVYETQESEEKIVVLFKNTQASPEIQSFIELNDLVVRHIEIEKTGQDLKVTIPLSEPIRNEIFELTHPPRLAIDFGREYINVVSDGIIAGGVEHLKVKKGIASGVIHADVLKVDLEKAQVLPAFANKFKPNLFESFVNILTPWMEQQNRSAHFLLEKVSEIVAQHDALAGINGTYFSYSGRPLGALMIDQELVSLPIYDRTAFFLDENNAPYIDSISISGYFKLSNGTRYKIDGINEPRDADDTIMYTPAWGKTTRTNSYGIEFIVSGSTVTAVNVEDSEIPDDGYVLSVRGPALQALTDSLKIGDKVSVFFKIVPYASSPNKIIHLVSGGPRLIKGGIPYISKHEEKFKQDIASGRAARTAIGFTQQGELLLVTVDGLPKDHHKRKESEDKISLGATLEELSNLMLYLGAFEAMNLDGGSSSTMVVNGKVVNSPVAGSQRRISNAIIIKPKS